MTAQTNCLHCDSNDWDCQYCNAEALKLKAESNQTAHVCGTCGGDGNCMDCKTFSLKDARACLDELNRLKEIIPNRPFSPITNAKAMKSVCEEISEIESYIVGMTVTVVHEEPKTLDELKNLINKLVIERYHFPEFSADWWQRQARIETLLRRRDNMASDKEISNLRVENQRLESLLHPVVAVNAATDKGMVIGYRWFVEAPQMVCIREGAKDTYETAQQAAQDYIESGEIKSLKGNQS